MMRAAFLAAGLVLAACGADRPPVPDPAMDADVRRQIDAGVAVQARAMRAGGFEPLALTARRAAPVRFDGGQVICAEKAESGERVLVVELVEFVDGPLQGPWFDYLWRRSGC